MAIKVGTENKRNVIIAVVLFVILAYLAVSQLTGGPPTPKPVTAPVVTSQPGVRTPIQPTGTQAIRTTTASEATAPAAHKIAGLGLDPALHLEKLAVSESIEYAGSGRNIFSADSTPVVVEQARAPARPVQTALAANLPPPIPQPPAIDLHYFGYSANREGKKQAFLMHGEDIFEAQAGEIVNHRYKVVDVEPHSVQVTDLSYNNTQTLPLSAN